MMGVKHSAPIEFTDIVTSRTVNSDCTDSSLTDTDENEIPNVELIPNLKSNTYLKAEVLKANDVVPNGSVNGSADIIDPTLTSVIELEDGELDENAPITPELEDELLADEDDDNVKVVDNLSAETTPQTAFAKTTSVSETTELADTTDEKNTSDNSTPMRDPGEDLDELLSKINDIVEDCVVPSEDVEGSEEDKEKEEITAEAGKTTDQDNSVIAIDDSFDERGDDKERCDNICVEAEGEEEELNKTPEENSDAEASVDNNETSRVETGSEKKEVEATAKENVRKSVEPNEEKQCELNTEEADLLPATETKSTEKGEANQGKPGGESDLNKEVENEEENETVIEEDAINESVDKTVEEKHEGGKENEAATEVVETVESVTAETLPEAVTENVTKVVTDDIKAAADFVPPTAGSEKVAEMDIPSLKPDDELVSESKEVHTNEETKASLSSPAITVDADDSDDDVVFLSEKPCDVIKEKRNTLNKNKVQKEIEETVRAKQKVVDDDDVVLLDDDDDDDDVAKALPDATTVNDAKQTNENVECEKNVEKSEVNIVDSAEKKEECEENSKENRPNPLDVQSDNACDTFGDAGKNEKAEEGEPQSEAQKAADAEETNSNCSSSSNLLQESKAVNNGRGEDEGDVGNDDDDGNDDNYDNDCEDIQEVEIIESEVGDDESKGTEMEEKFEPAAKRMRLSADGDAYTSKTLDRVGQELAKGGDTEIAESVAKAEGKAAKMDEVKAEEGKTALKRTHSENFDGTEWKEKKPKTEEVPSKAEDEKKDNQVEVLDSKEDIIEIKDEVISRSAISSTGIDKNVEALVTPIKVIPSHTPVPLYPPPNLAATAPELSLDFFKRFKKSLNKMTKVDLEELVLQKIVEAVIHKSEFGEMRQLIEKHENVIALQRTKINELLKQFRDLEMVHSRVIKDIEANNSQYVMPVKITRAVGLQVLIQQGKKNSDQIGNTACSTASATSDYSPQHPSSPYRRGSPETNTSVVFASPPRSAEPPTGLIRSSSPNLGPSSVLASAGAAAAVNSRRGCTQKITPQRPTDPSVNSSHLPPAGIYRSVQTPQTPSSQQIPVKVLNKSATSTVQTPIRGRYSGGPTTMTHQQHKQQQILRRQTSPHNNTRKASQVSPSAAVSKTPSTKPPNMQQYRRSDPPPQTSIPAATLPDNCMSSIHQMSGSMPAVSITPARPKDKSVIDLTDEDDVPSSNNTPVARQNAAAARASNTSAPNSSNYTLNKMSNSHSRLPHILGQPNKEQSARQQMSGSYAPKTNSNASIPASISTPPCTSITRVPASQVNSPLQRVKYGHPAPLPPTPAQNLHPRWKLPPPRPTIRISNVDNGIVISWTVEEPTDRHADCVSYQIYAYQETSGPPLIDSWRHVGDVKAMLLPMAVTLTQFQEGQRYFFAVRAVDMHNRVGPFSVPKTWS